MTADRCTRAALAAALCLTALTVAGCRRASTKDRKDGKDAPASAENVELIELYAPWHPASKMQAPVTEKIAKEYAGRAKATRIDVEKDAAAAERWGVKPGAPVFVLLVDGKESKRLTGLQSAKELARALDEALAGD